MLHNRARFPISECTRKWERGPQVPIIIFRIRALTKTLAYMPDMAGVGDSTREIINDRLARGSFAASGPCTYGT